MVGRASPAPLHTHSVVTAAASPFEAFDRATLERNSAMRDALRGGELVQDPAGFMKSSGITGPPRLVQVRDAALGMVPAIRKEGSGTFPLLEEFANEFAERLGIGYMTAGSVARDGGVVIEIVPGTQARKAGVRGVADLEAAIGAQLAAGAPNATAAEVADRARIDRQLVQVFDHALAIPDRHARNLMVDAASKRVTLIDASEALGGNVAGEMEPRMMRRYMAGNAVFSPHQSIKVDADVRALVRERMSSGTLATMLESVRARPGFDATSAGRLADPAHAATILPRLEEVVAQGVARYRYDARLEFVFDQLGNVIDEFPKLATAVAKIHA